MTFFRTLGSSFGASIMGTIYANRLADVLPEALAKAGVQPVAAASPALVHQLPEAQRTVIVQAYAEALHTPFLYVVPVALFGLVLAFFLPQVAMRGTAQEAMRSAGEGFAMPTDQDSDTYLETVIGRIVRQHPDAADAVLTRAGVDVDRPTLWGLLGVHVRGRVLDAPARQDDIEDRLGVPHGVLTSFFDELVERGLLERFDETLRLTDEGTELIEQIMTGWRDWLLEQLHDWLPDEDETELAVRARAAVTRIARRALLEQDRSALSR